MSYLFLIRLVSISAFISLCHAKSALITGGAGFVGRNFASKLCELGWKVTIVDNMISESSIHPKNWPVHLRCRQNNIEFVRMDCRDYFKLPESGGKWDLFIHLAAIIGGREKIEFSEIEIAENLVIDYEAFQWATSGSSNKCSKMIYFSSSAVYPISLQTGSDYQTLKEEHLDFSNVSSNIGLPDRSYGWSKLTGEYLARLAKKEKGLKVAIYRPMSGYGSDQDSSYPFKSILNRVMRKDDPIFLWSDASRDFIHISDIVSCVLSQLDSEHFDGLPINLATGIPTNFSSLALEMARQIGYIPKVKVLKNKPAGVNFRIGDPSSMLRQGCEVTVSLKEGISKSIEELLKPTDIREEKYSSYHCIGGSQTFQDWKLQHRLRPHVVSKANADVTRVCMFENVCVVDGDIVYFEDPDPLIPQYTKLSSFEQGIIYLGMSYSFYDPETGESFPATETGMVRPTIYYTTVPQDAYYPDDNLTYFYQRVSFSHNFGHALYDDLLPAFAAAKTFNVDPKNTLLGYFGCDLQLGTTPWDGKLKSKLCEENIKFYSKVIFSREAVNAGLHWSKKNFCMRRLIMGHTVSLGLEVIDIHRGIFMRDIRDSALAFLNASKPSTHRILVYIKRVGASGKGNWSNLCEDVKFTVDRLMQSRSSTSYVDCVDPVTQTSEMQLQDAFNTTIFVAEHGTLSHSALFSHNGAVLISVGNKEELKEPQVLLYANHFKTFYMVHENKEDLFGLIKYSMKITADAFNFHD